MDLDILDCFRRKNPLSYNQRNMIISFGVSIFKLFMTIHAMTFELKSVRLGKILSEIW